MAVSGSWDDACALERSIPREATSGLQHVVTSWGRGPVIRNESFSGGIALGWGIHGNP